MKDRKTDEYAEVYRGIMTVLGFFLLLFSFIAITVFIMVNLWH